MADLNLLQELCLCNGISGSEEAVRTFIIRQIAPYVTDYQIDPLGSIIAFKKGRNRPKTDLMLSAHMDEVGLIVTHITDEGYLHFACVGGIDKRILPGKRVFVGDVPGVICTKPVHLLDGDEKKAAVETDRMVIDIGAEDQETAQAAVSLGDPVFFDTILDLSGGMIKTKALDDRAGCAILIDLLRQDLDYDMTFVFCVQEEVGLRGSRAAAYAVDPQAAIVVESTTAADIPGIEPDRQVCHVGQGPVLSFMDRATIYDKAYYHLALAISKANDIPCQIKQAVAGGNDAGAIHTTRGGIRTIAVSLPCRYLHSPVSLISQEDYHNTEKLVSALANSIAGE